MTLITRSPSYNIIVRWSHRLTGSFDHDSSFHPRTHADSYIFSHEIDPITKNKSSHSSHDEDETLRVSPLQVDNISHEFDRLETWPAQEN